MKTTKVLPTRVGMFRGSRSHYAPRARSPHTRGDVPFPPPRRPPPTTFSPHAWGCSAPARSFGKSAAVLPTRVGMFRARPTTTSLCMRSPHTRGDVPFRPVEIKLCTPFSPHAWGCSGVSRFSCHRRGVLPTRVGMFLPRVRALLGEFCSPHTRGDVPVYDLPGRGGEKFSPHAWGCSDLRRAAHRQGHVLPTCVGMFRRHYYTIHLLFGSPHMRGDVPFNCPGRASGGTFSPHAWGCSAVEELYKGRPVVLPTCVGMFRRCDRAPSWRACSPHMRGDVPLKPSPHSVANLFSPHAWGCSGRRMHVLGRHDVLPTCVGMFRGFFGRRRRKLGSPHMRGDVPFHGQFLALPDLFSPHAWGCSATPA